MLYNIAKRIIKMIKHMKKLPKSRQNVSLLLHLGYDLEQASTLCSYSSKELPRLQKEFSETLAFIEKTKKQTDDNNNDFTVEIFADSTGFIRQKYE